MAICKACDPLAGALVNAHAHLLFALLAVVNLGAVAATRAEPLAGIAPGRTLTAVTWRAPVEPAVKGGPVVIWSRGVMGPGQAQVTQHGSSCPAPRQGIRSR